MKSTKSILLVEDDIEIRKVVTLILESEGYQVIAAVDGLDAKNVLCSSKQPDIIMLDLIMPRMSGYEFLSDMGIELYQRNIPVIVLTAYASPEILEGSQEVLLKPFLVEDLLTIIERKVVTKSPQKPNDR